METIRHKFKGFGTHDSEVLVHIKEQGSCTLICFEDINNGTSVTNASEQLATEIVALKELDPVNCRFFEYYGYNGEEADVITYDWNGKEASNPDWRRLDPEKIFWK